MRVKAKESPQVLKMRRKLKKQMVEEHRHVTPKALKETRRIMENWIARHQGERIDLKNKTIAVFDENLHSAKTHSKYVLHLLSTLKHAKPKTKSTKDLSGRIHQS